MAPFTGSLELAGLHASSHSILAVWWPTVGYYLHHCHMPQCWRISGLFVCSFLHSRWFPSTYIFPSSLLCLPHSRSFYLCLTHTYKQGRVTTHSAVICLSALSHSPSYTFTKGTAAQLFPLNISPHDGETGFFRTLCYYHVKSIHRFVMNVGANLLWKEDKYKDQHQNQQGINPTVKYFLCSQKLIKHILMCNRPPLVSRKY